MPIDLRLLTKNDYLWTELEASLRARAPALVLDKDHGAVASETTLGRLRACLAVAREVSQRLESYRHRRREQQNGATKAGLDDLEAQHQMAQHELQDLLQTVPNYVDFELQQQGDLNDFDDADSKLDRSICNIQSKESLHQTMFCVGGYEELGTSNVCMLTGVGMGLFRAVEEYVLEGCGRVPSIVQSELVELPAALAMTRDNGSFDVSTTPSWKTFIKHYLSTGRKYFDRQLPQSYLLITRSHNECMHHIPPITTHCNKQQRAWYENLAVRHRIEVLLVAGPSVAVDSRRLQLEWMRQLRDVYHRLAPGAGLALRAAPAADLRLGEASRLVLEGQLPWRKEPVPLASLANLLDYESAGLRHGNSIDKRFLHLLHGHVCDVGLAVEWMLQHATLDSDRGRVHLPAGLHPQGDSLAIVRRIAKKKGGRVVVEACQPVKSEKAAPEQGLPARVTTAQGLFGSYSCDEKPSTARIRLEAASCPFDFLPFYYR